MNAATKKRNATYLLFSALMVVSSLSLAGDKPHKSDKTKYKPSAYAEVIEVTPIYREVRVSTPVQECWQQPLRQVQRRQHGADATGTLVGGIIGGVIGHQFGQGRGNKLATALGTLIGAQAGHDASNNSSFYSQRSFSRYEERCEVKNQLSYEQVIDNYRVDYRYKGSHYQTYMPYDPGDRIKVKVRVEPVF